MGLSVLLYDGEAVEVAGRRLSGRIGVDDLRARCALLPRGKWEQVCVDALQALALARESRADLADLEVAAPLLRARVQSEGSVLADDAVSVALCDGLVEVLQVERDGVLTPVPSAVAASWDVPVAELLQRGREQVLAAELPTVEPVDVGVDGVVSVATQGPYAGSQLHRLAALLDVPPAGALVAVPTRHLLLAAPLVSRRAALEAAQALLVNADALWTAGPGSLSPDLFWVRGDLVTHLPGSPTSLSPPLEFVEVLDALPG
jgi:hypothetical protein